MPLLAYNKTTAPLVLAAGTPAPTLPAASSTGAHGPAVDVTAELINSNTAAFTAIMAQVTADLVTFNWSNTIEEFLTGPLLVGFENHDYFVNPATGSDSNPGTLAQPFLTLDGAHDAISALGTYRGRMRVNLSAGTFPIAGRRRWQLSRLSGKLATPLVYIGTPTDELGTLVASVGDTDALEFTIAGAVPGVADDYFGATILSTSGANNGQRRMCVANTAGAGPNTFKVNEQFYNASIAPGDTFLVQRNASVITPGGGLFNPSQMIAFGMKYITIQGGALGTYVSALFATSCEFRNMTGGIDGSFQSEWFAGGFANPWAIEGANNPFASSSFPAGAYINNTDVRMLEGHFFESFLCIKDSIMRLESGNYSFSAVFQKNSSIIARRNSIVTHLGPLNFDYTLFNILFGRGEALSTGTAGLPGVGAWHFADGVTVPFFNNLKLEGSPTDAITSQGAGVTVGVANTPGFVTRPWVVGSTAAGAGVSAKQVGQVINKILSAATGAAATTTATGFSGLVGAGLDTTFNVGDLIEISGAAIAGNNQVYKITAVVSPTEANTAPAPTSPDGNDGAISWVLFNAPHLTGVGGDLLLGGRLDSVGAQVGGVAVTSQSAATPDVNGNRGVNDTALNRASSIQFDTNVGS